MLKHFEDYFSQSVDFIHPDLQSGAHERVLQNMNTIATFFEGSFQRQPDSPIAMAQMELFKMCVVCLHVAYEACDRTQDSLVICHLSLMCHSSHYPAIMLRLQKFS